MPKRVPTDEKKTERLHMLISPDELAAIDDWRFQNRIGTRAEAVRRLCIMALELQAPAKRSAYLAAQTLRAFNRAMKSLPGGKAVPVEEELAVFHELIDDMLPSVMELIVSSDGTAELVDAIRNGRSVEEAQKLVEKKKKQIAKALKEVPPSKGELPP